MQLTTVQPLPRSSPAGTALRDKASTPASGFATMASSARTQPTQQQQQDSTFARTGCGMAIHFSPADPRVYLAATEDGPVHRHVHTNACWTCVCNVSAGTVACFISALPPNMTLTMYGTASGAHSMLMIPSAYMGMRRSFGLLVTHLVAARRCSTAYAEQYLATYRGHTGPCYQVQWSPTVPGVFLTASADWTVKLWHQDEVSLRTS